MGEITLRKSQQEVAEYSGGYMGVSAVPGSGKTTTLCALAVRLIKERIKVGQRILIVTYQNAAVANIQSRIMSMLDQESLLPTGYDVRTLHSLSRGILKENPGLIGLDRRFEVLDENTVARILDNSVDIWCRTNAARFEAIQKAGNIRNSKRLKSIIRNIGRSVIDSSKDKLISHDQLSLMLANSAHDQDGTSFLKLGSELYSSYQNEIENRGAVDFNDLVRYSVKMLRDNPDILDRYRERWPFILEDEAQDSVPLQQELLSGISGEGGNWVRVGDPNQAIMSTFTSAEPAYLMRFLEREDVDVKPLLKAGRSAQPIIDLANNLVRTVSSKHPIDPVRRLSFRKQFIEPTLAGDPQPNPPATESKVVFQSFPLGSQEIGAACDKLLKWVSHYRGKGYTYAILTPNNRQGLEVIAALRARNVEHVEMLKTSTISKLTAKGVSDILELLAYPCGKPSLQNTSGFSLTTLINRVYRFIESLDESSKNGEEAADLKIFQNFELESFLYPSPVQKKYLVLDSESLEKFRTLLRKWFDALLLPVDQLILTITDDIFKKEQAEVGRRIARLVKGWAEDDPQLSMPELSGVLLTALTNNRVRLEDEQSELEPSEDVVSVSTLHKSKGLEWDFVFVLHATCSRFHYSYDDYFFGEYKDLGGYPDAIAKSDLTELLDGETSDPLDPKAEVIAEDMRLMYVAITRARRFLSITWNEKDDGRDYRVVPSKMVQELAKEIAK